MNVLYLTLTTKGGMIHYMQNLIASSPSFVNSIIIQGRGKDFDKRTEKNIYFLPLNIIKFPIFLSIFIKLLRKYNPDIIHITGPHYYLPVIYLFIKNIPKVITLHDIKPHLGEHHLISTLICKLYISNANKIFIHGENLKQLYAAEGYDLNKIVIIPHGDYSFFLDYLDNNIKEDRNSILFFGRIERYKGLNNLVDAIIELSRRYDNIKLTIAGNGNISDFRHKIKYDKHFEIHNEFIPDNEVSQYFQRASIIVLPYIEGSQTGIIPIAYAFKKPVIVTNVGSIPEVVDHHKTGIIIEPNNVKSIINAIEYLILNDNIRKEMGNAGYLKMKNELSWDLIGKKTFEIYCNLLRNKKE